MNYARLRKRAAILSLILGMVLFLSAGGGNNNNNSGNAASQTSETVNTEDSTETVESKVYRDILNIAITAQPPLLDAHQTVSNAAAGISNHIFETLLTLDKDYLPVPQLATSYDVSEDSLVYTFYLREGIKFHNGKELTSEDVVVSMNRWLIASSRAAALLSGAIFEAIDDYTLTLTVREATSDIINLIASPAQFPAVMPKEVVENIPAEGLSEYIKTNPYKFAEWRQDQYIRLEKYDEYKSLEGEVSGHTGARNGGTKEIYFYFVPDNSTRIAGVKTGEYDIAESIPLENYNEVASDENLVVNIKQSGSLNLFLNTSDGVLSNPVLRQAVLATLNNNEILLASYAEPELYILDPGFMNLVQTQWAVKSGAEYYNQSNPEKAKELFTDGEYDDEPIRLLTTRDYSEMYNATLVVQEQLRQVGVNAEVINFDFATFLETKNDRTKWDIFITSNSYQLTPPQISAVNPNWAGFDQPRVAEALLAIRQAESQEEATKEWENLQQYIYEFGAATVIGHYNSVIVTSKKIEGFNYFHNPVYWNTRIAE